MKIRVTRGPGLLPIFLLLHFTRKFKLRELMWTQNLHKFKTPLFLFAMRVTTSETSVDIPKILGKLKLTLNVFQDFISDFTGKIVLKTKFLWTIRYVFLRNFWFLHDLTASGDPCVY